MARVNIKKFTQGSCKSKGWKKTKRGRRCVCVTTGGGWRFRPGSECGGRRKGGRRRKK